MRDGCPACSDSTQQLCSVVGPANGSVATKPHAMIRASACRVGRRWQNGHSLTARRPSKAPEALLKPPRALLKQPDCLERLGRHPDGPGRESSADTGSSDLARPGATSKLHSRLDSHHDADAATGTRCLQHKVAPRARALADHLGAVMRQRPSPVSSEALQVVDEADHGRRHQNHEDRREDHEYQGEQHQHRGLLRSLLGRCTPPCAHLVSEVAHDLTH